MKYTKKITLLISIIFITMLMSMLVVATENTTITEYRSENTYILNNEKNINTTINGDLFLITAKTNIQGTINKDLNAISADIIIQGIIGDDLRLIASTADINTYIFGELNLIVDQLNIKNSTIVQGKTSIIATDATIAGTYNDDFEITSKKITINGVFQENVKIKGDKITINPTTQIQGDLQVTKNTLVPEGVVGGDIIFIESATPTKSTKDLLIEKIILFLTIAILASIIALIAKKPTQRATEKIMTKPLHSIIIGFGAIILLPILSLIALISVVTAPIGLIIIFTLLILLLLTPAIIAIMLGEQITNLMKNRHELRLSALLGSAILVVLSFIPGVLGFIIFLFYSLLLGATILLIFPRRKNKKRKTKTITTKPDEATKKTSKKTNKKTTKKK